MCCFTAHRLVNNLMFDFMRMAHAMEQLQGLLCHCMRYQSVIIITCLIVHSTGIHSTTTSELLTERYEQSCSMMKELQEDLSMLQASGTCSPQLMGGDHHTEVGYHGD